MKHLNLFVDESGQSNPKTQNSGTYILSGCVVDSHNRESLSIEANQIKFKYWDRTNIIFHSREIGRKEGEFSILKDPKIQTSFEKDLFHFLNRGNYKTFFIVVDLKKAKARNWNEDKVHQDTTRLILKYFILALLASDNCRGRVIVESATSKKDFYFHKAASYYLSVGLPELKIYHQRIQDVLTEISFVTKKNHDIEEQIADLLAYSARLKFENRKPTNKYEFKIKKVLDNKLFLMHPNTGNKKRRFYSKIQSFKIIP
ncbi:MAG: DUF3800 domain-containing protein [bacterium]